MDIIKLVESPKPIRELHQCYLILISRKLFAKLFLEKAGEKRKSVLRNRELYQKRHIVGLIFGVQRGAVAADLAAFCAFMNNDKSFFCVRLGAYRLKLAAAFVCSVAGVDVNV